MFSCRVTAIIIGNGQLVRSAIKKFQIVPICRNITYKEDEITGRGSVPIGDLTGQKIVAATAVKRVAIESVEFVDKLLRMDEVKKAQDNVMDVKMKLKETGDRKREILRDLARIRQQLNQCTEQSHRLQRGSKEFFEAVSEERKLSEIEQSKQTEFENMDEEERKLFNSLTLAINYSYEKERLYSNTIRNLGIISTVLASVLSFIGATIGYYLHNKKSGVLVNSVEQIIDSKLDNFKNDLNSEMFHRIFKKDQPSPEGWGQYMKRHATGVYRWFWPK